MYYSLTYVSSRVPGVSDEEVERMALNCQASNAQRGVSGALLATSRDFIQCIEGQATDVRQLYYRIRQDPRHRNVRLVSHGSVLQRNFEEASMHFRFDTLVNMNLEQVMGDSEIDIFCDMLEGKQCDNNWAIRLMRKIFQQGPYQIPA